MKKYQTRLVEKAKSLIVLTCIIIHFVLCLLPFSSVKAQIPLNLSVQVDSISTDAVTPGITVIFVYGSNLNLVDSIAIGEGVTSVFTISENNSLLHFIAPEFASTGPLRLFFNGTEAEFQQIIVQAARAATPFITPIGGTFQTSPLITITSPTPDAEIYYTTNGMIPVIGSSFTRKYTGPFYQLFSGHIRAVAIRDGLLRSRVRWQQYTVNEPLVVGQVEVSPPGGVYNSAKTITLSCTTEGAQIYYTTNGNSPVVGSVFTSLYEGPFTIGQTSVNVRAIAVKEGLFRVFHTSEFYTLSNIQQVAAPVLVPASDNIQRFNPGQPVTMSTVTPDATIYYTLDGSTPQPWSASTFVYTAPIILNRTERIIARAMKVDMVNSSTVRSVYRVGLTSGRFGVDDSFEDDNLPTRINLFPNPAQHIVNIAGDLKSVKHISLINMQGKQVAVHSKSLTENHLQIALEHLQKGLYIVRIHKESGNTEDTRLLVN